MSEQFPDFFFADRSAVIGPVDRTEAVLRGNIDAPHARQFAIDQYKSFADGADLPITTPFPSGRALAAAIKDVRKGLIWVGDLRPTTSSIHQNMKIDGRLGGALIVGGSGRGKTLMLTNIARLLLAEESIDASLVEPLGHVEDNLTALDSLNPDSTFGVLSRRQPMTYAVLAEEYLQHVTSEIHRRIRHITDEEQPVNRPTSGYGRHNWKWILIDDLSGLRAIADDPTWENIFNSLEYILRFGPEVSVGVIATGNTLDELPPTLITMFATQIGLGTRRHPAGMFPTRGTRFQDKVAGTVMLGLQARLRSIDIPGRAFCIWTPGNGALCEFQAYEFDVPSAYFDAIAQPTNAQLRNRLVHGVGPPDSVGSPT